MEQRKYKVVIPEMVHNSLGQYVEALRGKTVWSHLKPLKDCNQALVWVQLVKNDHSWIICHATWLILMEEQSDEIRKYYQEKYSHFLQGVYDQFENGWKCCLKNERVKQDKLFEQIWGIWCEQFESSGKICLSQKDAKRLHKLLTRK